MAADIDNGHCTVLWLGFEFRRNLVCCLPDRNGERSVRVLTANELHKGPDLGALQAPGCVQNPQLDFAGGRAQ